MLSVRTDSRKQNSSGQLKIWARLTMGQIGQCPRAPGDPAPLGKKNRKKIKDEKNNSKKKQLTKVNFI